MAPGKISCELTGSPSLNKVFELNWIEMKCAFVNVSYDIQDSDHTFQILQACVINILTNN